MERMNNNQETVSGTIQRTYCYHDNDHDMKRKDLAPKRRNDDGDDVNRRRSSSSSSSSSRTICLELPVEEIVEERLKSPWGRPIHPLPHAGEISWMHQRISAIRYSPTTIVDGEEEEEREEDNDDGNNRTLVAAQTAQGRRQNFRLQRLKEEEDDEDQDDDEEEPWQNILLRCKSHPYEAALLDRRGQTCLHAICAKNPPLSVVVAILEACGRHGEPVLERDKHGRTPLTIAISNDANFDVVSLLLRRAQRSAYVCDHLGYLPLHFAVSKYKCNYYLEQDDEYSSSNNYNNNNNNNNNHIDLSLRRQREQTQQQQQRRRRRRQHEQQLDLIRLLLDLFPAAAGRESNDGKTPLHLAIESKSSIDIIQCLTTVCPTSVIMDGCGINPLFLAIRYDCALSIIRCLVEAYPSVTHTRDRAGGYPLQRAIENQSLITIQQCLCVSSEVVLHTDRILGKTVLHSALECGSVLIHESMVKVLLQMAPQVSVVADKFGQTPLSLASERYIRFKVMGSNRNNTHQQQQLWPILCHLMKAAYYGYLDDDGDDDDDDDDDVTKNGDNDDVDPDDQERETQTRSRRSSAVATTNTTVRRMTPQNTTKTKRTSLPVLHAAIALDMDAAIIDTALKLHHHETQMLARIPTFPIGDYSSTTTTTHNKNTNTTNTNNAYNSYPLWLAIQSSLSSQKETNNSRSGSNIKKKEHIILRVLQISPQIAGIPDSNGRLALSMAAQANYITNHVLRQLWYSHPPALRYLDPYFQLYPFQIAALPKHTTNVPNDQSSSSLVPSTAVSTTTTTTTRTTTTPTPTQDKNSSTLLEKCLQLTSIFVLLVAAPDLVHCPINI